VPYAIVQNSLAVPSVEQVARAFRALPSLTDHDAPIVAGDAFGILVQGLELADAGRLLQALHAEGVEAEMVDQKSLPPLPPPKPLRRAECLPDRFVAYDHLGRPRDLEWSHVILLAAGAVLLTEFRHIVRERVVFRRGPRGGAMPVTEMEHKDKEEQNLRPVLEILLDVEPGRYHIAAEKFNYGYLGERLSSDRAQNYVSVVRDCLTYATGAVLNRGAQAVQDTGRPIFQYPTKHAFEEETIWLLWRHFGAGRSEA